MNDDIGIIFMTRFEEKRLEEIKDLVESVDNVELKHVLLMNNDTQLSRQIQKAREVLYRLKQQYYKTLLYRLPRERVSEETIKSYLREFELYQHQTEIGKFITSQKEYTDLTTKISDLEIANRSLRLDKYRFRKRY